MSSENKIKDIILQELLAVAFGTKPSVLFSLSVEDQNNIIRLFPDLKIVDGEKKLNYMSKANGLSNFAIAKDEEIAHELIDAQAKQDHRRIGKLLGYPDCCIDEWTDRTIDFWSRDLIYLIDQNSKKRNFLLNNVFNFSTRLTMKQMPDLKDCINRNFRMKGLFQNLQIISHIPCSYDCQASKKIGKENFGLLQKYYPKTAKILKYYLSRPILFFDCFEWIVFDTITKEDDLFCYTKITSPVSLLDRKITNKVIRGNKFRVDDKKIDFFKDKKLIFTYSKKNKMDGFLLEFSG